MDIEVERGIATQRGRPKSVFIKLIGNNGDVKAVVTVSPKFTAKKDDDTFHIEVWSGNTLLDKPVDIKLNI